MRTRYTLLAVVLATAVAISIATGGVSPAQLDRGAAIDVVGDSAANLGYEATCSDERFQVTITNRFDRPIGDLSVSVNGSTAAATPLPVHAGDSRTVGFDAEQVSPGDSVSVRASADGVDAALDRAAPSSCS